MSAFVTAGGTEREGKAFFAQLGNGATKSAVITIKFLGGTFTEFETGDDGNPVNGDDATYELLGDDSIQLTGAEGTCVSTYTYQVQGDRLRMRSLKQCAGDHDAPYGTTLYASFPFTRIG